MEALEGGEKPAVMLIGHYHKMECVIVRNVWVIQTGCAKDQDPFMRKKGIEYGRRATAARRGVGRAGPGGVLDVDGVRRAFAVHQTDAAVFVDDPSGSSTLVRLPRFPDPNALANAGSLLAPMPGAVVRVARPSAPS